MGTPRQAPLWNSSRGTHLDICSLSLVACSVGPAPAFCRCTGGSTMLAAAEAAARSHAESRNEEASLPAASCQGGRCWAEGWGGLGLLYSLHLQTSRCCWKTERLHARCCLKYLCITVCVCVAVPFARLRRPRTPLNAKQWCAPRSDSDGRRARTGDTREALNKRER